MITALNNLPEAVRRSEMDQGEFILSSVLRNLIIEDEDIPIVRDFISKLEEKDKNACLDALASQGISLQK